MMLRRSILLLILTPTLCLAQGKAPKITIPSPLNRVYLSGLQIASFKPIVDPTEGSIDAIPYGQVSTLAGSSSGKQDG